MDIRAFLSSKAAEALKQGSNQTTKTPTLKRASDGSGDSTRSSSKRKFVWNWLKHLPWLTYNVEANQMSCKLCRDNTTCSDTPSTFVSGCIKQSFHLLPLTTQLLVEEPARDSQQL